jgi:OFA family oxalate/formate antiporter-like MFS transporter
MLKKDSSIGILLACACAIFWPGSFIFGLPGVLRQHWQQAFQVGGGTVGGVVFFILTGATCCMYLSGRLQDKVGPGKLAALGALMSGGSTIWVSQSPNMTAVNLWAFLIGAASAFVYLPGLTAVQQWFPLRRGLVAGFFNMSFGLSAAVMSPVYTWLLSKWGYEIMAIAAGITALAIGLAASIFIRFPDSDLKTPSSVVSQAAVSRSVQEALKSREFWCLWLTWVFAGAAGASMLVLATGFGLAKGLSLAQAVFILTAFNVTNGTGRLISGYFSDRIGRSQTMAISFTCAGIAYVIMPHLASLWMWIVLAAIIGYAFGTLFAVSGPLAGDCFGMAHFGAIFGLIFTAYGFVSGPMGPWLSGLILDATSGNYILVFSYLGLMYLAAAGLILFVKPWQECHI